MYPHSVQPSPSSRSTALPSELALIRAIRRQAASISSRSLIQGIGDDCALLRPKPGYDLCVTTDFSLEGIHFRRDWHPPQSVGHRCLARGLSDLAAMGADPLAVFLSLALPARLPRTWLDGFLQGFFALAHRYRVPLAGGDTAQSPGSSRDAKILADIVAVGQLPRNSARLRSAARPGDFLYVTGALGGSAAELLTLSTTPANKRASVFRRHGPAALATAPAMKGHGPAALATASALKGHGSAALAIASALKGHGFSRAINASKKKGALAPEESHPHLYPDPRLTLGRRLRPLVHAIIDISDGLSTDLAHLCEESHIAADLDEALLPIHPLALRRAFAEDLAWKGHDFSRAAGSRKRVRALAPEEFYPSPLHLALHGGEDYELLFTAPPSAKIPRSIAGVPIHRIGAMRPRARHQPPILLKTHDGRRIPLPPAGWEHFR